MRIGTEVKTKSGKHGMVVENLMGACDYDEVPVVFDGNTHFEGTDEDSLIEIGIPEHKPDMEKCGGGKSKDCCIFLTMQGDGFTCERFGDLRNTLIFRTMNAKRHPSEPYPECMNQ